MRPASQQRPQPIRRRDKRRCTAAVARDGRDAAPGRNGPSDVGCEGAVRAASARGGPGNQSQTVTSEAAWCRSSGHQCRHGARRRPATVRADRHLRRRASCHGSGVGGRGGRCAAAGLAEIPRPRSGWQGSLSARRLFPTRALGAIMVRERYGSLGVQRAQAESRRRRCP